MNDYDESQIDWPQDLPPGRYAFTMSGLKFIDEIKGMEYPMPSKTRNELMEEIKSHQDAINKAMAQLQGLPELPEDIYEDGSVITFQKRWPSATGTGTWYRFAAFKVDGLWYLTQSSRYANKSPLDWEQLIAFMGKHVRYVKIVATWETIFEGREEDLA